MSRKFLVTIVLILFLLPFVSWYYLQSGLNWRKKAQEIMKGSQPFPSGKLISENGPGFSADSLVDRVSIVSFLSCDDSDTTRVEVLEAIYNQFKDTRKAAFILLDSCAASSANSAYAIGKKYWYVIPCSDSSGICNALVMGWEKDKMFALVDRKGIIRSYYGIATSEERKLLVEHMSLLLPRERQEKVELKRGEKK